jgi:hypothetical protein
MKTVYAIFIIVLSCVNLYATKSGYHIKVHIKGLSQSQLVLCHYLGGSVYPDDTLSLNNNGNGVFSGMEKLQQGVYMIYFADGSYFDILIGEDQTFALETDSVDYAQNLKVTGSIENEVFSSVQSFMIDIQSKLKAQQSKYNDSLADTEKEQITKAIKILSSKRTEEINNICRKYPDLFVSTFLKASLDIEVPKELAKDPELRYNYYKANYFNNFDLSDLRLLYTPIFNDKIFTYLDKVIPQVPDSLIKAIDMIIGNSRVDSTYYIYTVGTLFNKYINSEYMGMDAVFVHIAERYYLNDSWWNSDKFLQNLTEQVTTLKPLLIGKSAPNVQLRYVPDEHFIKAKSDTALKRYPHAGSFFKINDVKADFTILAFWDASCGYCKIAIPRLHQIYIDTLASMNVKVVAISTLFGEDGKEKWIDFVNKHEMFGWINSWNPYDYQFKKDYDIKTNPQFFILNSEKAIIGKRLGVEQIADFITMFKKINEIK